MSEFRLNNKIYCGSSNQASAISYINEDGSKATVQDKINNIENYLKNFNTRERKLADVSSPPVNTNIFLNEPMSNFTSLRMEGYYSPGTQWLHLGTYSIEAIKACTGSVYLQVYISESCNIQLRYTNDNNLYVISGKNVNQLKIWGCP